MFKFRSSVMVFIIAFISSLSFADPTDSVFPNVQVQVKKNVYGVEYANTFELRAQGLMHREEMCQSCGMLFNFQQVKRAGMWMKNTLIPLDVAFINPDGKITDIKAMKPHDLSTTSSSEPVLYAWEMNQGWFAQNGIQVGDTVTFPLKNDL
jgi:uncharacterized membrane protein (UPF0127 family)